MVGTYDDGSCGNTHQRTSNTRLLYRWLLLRRTCNNPSATAGWPRDRRDIRRSDIADQLDLSLFAHHSLSTISLTRISPSLISYVCFSSCWKAPRRCKT